MAAENKPFPNIRPAGDSALLIELDCEITLEVNARVHALDRQMQKSPFKGVREWVPAYTSLLVHYDPLVTKYHEIEDWVLSCFENSSIETIKPEKEIIIPIHYGGEIGPDLENVAAYHQISPEEVIRKHSEVVYRVGMMGFTPGFAYLMGLDTAIATPRKDTPRMEVPAGSVGIAGGQTGIYPLVSPGGWQIIGRTEKRLFDPTAAPYFLLSPGDLVRFVPVREGKAR